jgi:phage head maturation protease
MSENRPPLEVRNTSEVTGVDVKQRIIEVIAVPYGQEAPVPYRGDMWLESFERGAFDGIETRANPVLVNREHKKGDTVGKVLQWWPERTEGLVAEVRIARTARGDETLALAEEGMIRASIGFGVRLRDQVLDRATMKRRIHKAFVDHLGLVEDPAYTGAEVLAVRGSEFDTLAADLPPIVARPAVDELAAWLASRRLA